MCMSAAFALSANFHPAHIWIFSYTLEILSKYCQYFPVQCQTTQSLRNAICWYSDNTSFLFWIGDNETSVSNPPYPPYSPCPPYCTVDMVLASLPYSHPSEFGQSSDLDSHLKRLLLDGCMFIMLIPFDNLCSSLHLLHWFNNVLSLLLLLFMCQYL